MSKQLPRNIAGRSVLDARDSSQVPGILEQLAAQRESGAARSIIYTRGEVVESLLDGITKQEQKKPKAAPQPKSSSLDKSDRKAAQGYINKPSQAFVSIESMAQVWRLTSSGEYPKLVAVLVKQAFGMFTDRVAFVYLTALLHLYLVRSSKPVEKRDARHALLLVNTLIVDKAAIDAACCKTFFTRLLNAMTRSGIPNGCSPLDQTCAAAYYMWSEHNRSFGHSEPTPPHMVAPALAKLYHLGGIDGDEEALDLLRRIHLLLRYHVLNLRIVDKFRLPILDHLPNGLTLDWPGTEGYKEYEAWSIAQQDPVFTSETEEMLAWIGSHRSAVQSRLEAMWHDIEHHGKRTLKPSGETIFVEGLAEECGNPVRILIHEDIHNFTLDTIVETHDISPNGKPTYHAAGMERAFITLLMSSEPAAIANYMGDMVGYHRIVCGDRHHSRSEHVSVHAPAEYEGAELVRKIQEIGGHLTPLYGRRRTSTAEENFRKERPEKAEMPDGMTWVKTHKRRQPLRLLSGQRLAKRIGRSDVEPAVIVDLFAIVEDLAKD